MRQLKQLFFLVYMTQCLIECDEKNETTLKNSEIQKRQLNLLTNTWGDYSSFFTYLQKFWDPHQGNHISGVQYIHRPPSIFNIEASYSPKISSNDNIFCEGQFIKQCQRQSPYRSYDGSCNNLNNPSWGMAQSRYARLLPPIYSDGIWKPAVAASGKPLPKARVLSYELFPELRIKDPLWTLLNMQWGQIVTHDMAEVATPPALNVEAVSCCMENGRLDPKNLNNPNCYPIVVDPDDPFYPQTTQCMTFNRAITDRRVGCPVSPKNPSEQITMVTQFLDLSIVYGSSQATALTLRTLRGGLLRSEIRKKMEWLPPADILNSTAGSCEANTPNNICYAAGDDRVNQNPQLTVLQTLLVREHNRIAKILSRINPHWNDETIYQETRRINIAQHQYITYYEWLPIILGRDNTFKYRITYKTRHIDYVDDYDPTINPNILNEHSNGAYRVFHSLVAGYLKLVKEDRSTSQNLLRLSNWFFRPSIIEQADNMDDLTRGLADQPEQQQDKYYDHEITLFLFRGQDQFGQDLRSIDIQRNRDVGLATYNDLREFCGLRRARNWADFTDYIAAESVEKLSRLYEHPDDVDLAVGGGLERNVEGSLTGPTFLCILIEQFYRSRVGDRFWFESPNPIVAFTSEQLREIRKTSIARILCDNSGNVRKMQHRAFQIPGPTNPIANCDDLPSMDLQQWRDYAPDLAKQQHQQQLGILYKK